MPEYTNLNDVIVDGRVESSAQGRIMGSFAVMPAASILNENCIILYSGTTGTYVSGQFYMCVESGGSYSWQPVTISGTEEDTYTANRALATNAQGQVVASGVTDTELGYLSGLGGSVVSLLNGKVDKVSGSRLMTDAEGTKLAGIAAGAQVNVIEAVQNNGVAVPVSGKTVNITHPTKLSEFTNDTQFITSTVSNLQNYYDKTNVDALISAIPKFSIQVSQSGLPASGNSTTIYLVPKTAGSQDAYDEYLYVNGQWEKIGSTQVNFSFDQSGTDILINGTAIRSATTSQSGVMTATQVGSLNTAVSGVSSLQSQYGTLNSTVSDISGRLGTVESTLSTTVSRISTLENKEITSGLFTLENGMLGLTLNRAAGNIIIPSIDLSGSITPAEPDIWGYEYSGSSPSITLIGAAEGITPMSADSNGGWANEDIAKIFTPYEIYNGTKKALNKRNPSQYADGGTVNTSLGHDFMVGIKTVGVRCTYLGDYAGRVEFTTTPDAEGFSYFRHSLGGEIQEETYTGMFRGYCSGSRMYSAPNQNFTTNISLTTAISNAQARGTGYDIWSYRSFDLTSLMAPMFFGTRNLETPLGGRYSYSGTGSFETFSNDFGMHRGTGSSDPMSFFWMQDYWGGGYQWVGGAYCDTNHDIRYTDNYASTTYTGWQTAR